jgi:hypothetical protein
LPLPAIRLKEQALFYGDIPDDGPIDYHDVDVRQGSPEELADAIEGFITSAEKAGMSRDGVQLTSSKSIKAHPVLVNDSMIPFFARLDTLRRILTRRDT